MSDSNKERLYRDSSCFLCLCILYSYSFYLFITYHFIVFAVPVYFYVRCLQHTLLHHLTCTHFAFTDEHVHIAAKFRKIKCFFTSCITCTYYRYFLVAEEETVAHCTSRNTM